MTEFLKRVVAQYYKTGRDAIRRYDTNHLVPGDKINANTDTMDTVLRVTSQFSIVREISVGRVPNRYASWMVRSYLGAGVGVG